MARKLDGKKVAILVADGFEQVEMTKPREALDEAGAQTKIVSLKAGKIQGMNHADKGDKFDVDLTVDQARPEKFDALMIPGGLFNPDVMRINERAQNFARQAPEGASRERFIATRGRLSTASNFERAVRRLAPGRRDVTDAAARAGSGMARTSRLLRRKSRWAARRRVRVYDG